MALLPIETARLRLRPLTAADVDALHEVYAHPEVARWIGAHTREDVAGEIALHVASQGAGLRRAGTREAYGETMLFYEAVAR